MQHRILALTLLCVVSTLVQRAAAADFVYQPFPDIPRATVTKDTFVEDLGKLCEGFERRCSKANPRNAEAKLICDDAPDPKLEADANRELSRSGSAILDVKSDEVWWYFAASIRQACSSIAGGKPLTDGDLAELRRLRDHEELRRVASSIAEGEDISGAIDDAKQPGQQQAPDIAAAALPGFEGLEGKLIQGLADFLAKRAKQEALAFLTKELSEEICSKERRPFFPSTCAAIETIEATRSLASIRVALKAAVEIDLKRLPEFALAFAMAQEKAPLAAKNLAFLGRIAVAYVGGLSDQRGPLDLARSIGAIPTQDCEKSKQCRESGHAFRFTSAVFYAAEQGGQNWPQFFASLDAAKSKSAAKVAWTAVSLLLLSEARWIATDSEAQPIATVRINTFIEKPVQLWLAVVELNDDWDAAVKMSKQLELPSDRIALFARTAESSLAKFSDTLSVSLWLVAEAEKLQSALIVVRELASTEVSLVQREYAPAFAHFTVALREGLPDAAFPESWNQHLALLVEIAEAKSAQDVSAALDDYAEPLGAYVTKYRKARVALNGMVGIFAGSERIKTQGVEGTSGALAGFAPVGIHVTTPLGSKGEDNSFHLGLLLSVIDLGAITTYRFQSELSGDVDGMMDPETPEVDQVPQVGFKQIVSPGAFLTLGLLGSPVVFGAGVSISPDLRRVTEDDAALDASVLRFGLTLGIDVPILFVM